MTRDFSSVEVYFAGTVFDDNSEIFSHRDDYASHLTSVLSFYKSSLVSIDQKGSRLLVLSLTLNWAIASPESLHNAALNLHFRSSRTGTDWATLLEFDQIDQIGSDQFRTVSHVTLYSQILTIRNGSTK